jgi:hypothetical protein
MDNLKTRMLREDLIKCMNGYDLPIEVKRLVLLEISQMTKELADNQIKTEQQQLAEQQAQQKQAQEQQKEEAGVNAESTQ